MIPQEICRIVEDKREGFRNINLSWSFLTPAKTCICNGELLAEYNKSILIVHYRNWGGYGKKRLREIVVFLQYPLGCSLFGCIVSVRGPQIHTYQSVSSSGGTLQLNLCRKGIWSNWLCYDKKKKSIITLSPFKILVP